jgi:FKBP-type peptidyl-prolyl cis-trans isomerase SlyD
VADMDTIQPNARVVLEYTLRDTEGEVLDSSSVEDGEPIVYVHGYGMIVPGLEVALAGLRAGEERDVLLSPEEAFGDHDEELVLEVDRTDFPDPAKVAEGDEFVAESPDGGEIPMRVIEVRADSVLVDANHPLAGQTLRYQVKVREVREATTDEVEAAAAEFEEAGYGEDDPEQAQEGGSEGSLVQLRSKKSFEN